MVSIQSTFFPIASGALLTVVLTSCTTVTTTQYEATALTSYVWQVEYATDPANFRRRRTEEFASTSLAITNGQRPDDAVTGPDDRGLWFPALPPRPTVDELEARQRPMEEIGTPELLTRVEYQLTFQEGGDTKTLSTDYSVYRQAVKAYADGAALELTLGPGETSVETATPR
ncbi:hypothetical protein IQ268_05845 [Oculatella sp. LEGE 06141]|uniref:hypothetical protein n=1 Tax=Oculatella sp. LEGE 06141 TaxID=1828648 RepID=UPI00187E2BE6|nr:hypothetical protein [Oculatella sp. LEGE 06141]MBE9178108.1 hypothetical protein [Oculatella sp. LEGE 06141]